VRKFWNYITDGNERILRLEGAIAEESWFGDEVAPKAFKSELNSSSGNITVWINSPGGDVFAASQIYTALKEYPGAVTVKIDGLAASAASVIAMAGSKVLMSPVSYMVIHNPATIAIGDSQEMQKAKQMLDEIKEGIINAYEQKTRQPRQKISQWMDRESCFNAKKAVELGFADDVLYKDNLSQTEDLSESVLFSRANVTNSLSEKLQRLHGQNSINDYYMRLNKIRF
jgi:ATP-dependent Clp protease protease subunit